MDELRPQFQAAYEAGLTGQDAAAYTGEVQTVAYAAGKLDAAASAKAAGYATLHGKDSGFIQTPAAKTISANTVETLNVISKALGIKTTVAETVYNGKANGSYKDGVVTIAADAWNPGIVVAKHEITHHLQQAAPKQYRAYRDYAVQIMSGRAGSTLVEKYQKNAAKAGVTLTTEQAMDEIAADYTEKILTDETALREFAQSMSQTAEKRSVAQKFFDAVRRFVQKVKSAFKGDRARMDAAAQREFGATVEQLERAESLWKEAFAEAAKAAETGKHNAVTADGQVLNPAQELGDSKTAFSLRTKEPPEKIGIAYKVFYAKNGQLYPPMVANPGGEGTPVGVWLDADIGKAAPDSKTGRPQVQAGGKGTNAAKGSLAFRPGWHLGDIPQATQFARKNPETGVKDLFPADFIWAECEYAMDVDYQDEAMSYGYTENGKFRHSYAGLPKLPTDGYYRYRTNPNPDTVPWVITGAMRVKRILTDAETDAICRKNGVEPMKRQGGVLNLEKLGLTAGDVTVENDTQYSLKGVREDGIEVYETSDSVMSMSRKERINEYLRLMSKDYALRTARFERNGHTYYAKFNQSDLRKPIYGDPRSSESGKKALVRAGSDGDFFDLVENADYDHSGKDTKNHANTDYFDYFVKTVQIDGKVYDLLADVKKQYGADGGYVYSLVLRDNKKIKASPATANLTASVYGAGQALTSKANISQKAPDVKEQFSLKGEAALMRENEKLREVNAALREQFKLTKFAKVDAKSLDKFTREVLKDYSSRADFDETRAALNAVYDYMANGENGEAAIWSVAQEKAYEAAQAILTKSVETVDGMAEYSEFKRIMRSGGISVTDAQAQDAGYRNANEFRKANFGRILVKKDGAPVDVFYQDMLSESPGLLDDEIINSGDQLMALMDLIFKQYAEAPLPCSHKAGGGLQQGQSFLFHCQTGCGGRPGDGCVLPNSSSSVPKR